MVRVAAQSPIGTGAAYFAITLPHAGAPFGSTIGLSGNKSPCGPGSGTTVTAGRGSGAGVTSTGADGWSSSLATMASPPVATANSIVAAVPPVAAMATALRIVTSARHYPRC